MRFLFKYTATTEIYTLSLHDALPILRSRQVCQQVLRTQAAVQIRGQQRANPAHALGATASRFASLPEEDRKSTRLNSSHPSISYAVFCLKKKKTKTKMHNTYAHQQAV